MTSRKGFVDHRDDDARGSRVRARERAVAAGHDDLDDPEDPDARRVDREQVELGMAFDEMAELKYENEHKSPSVL
jgi:hypothetical protein